MMIMIFINILFSMIFITLNHPLSMGVTLLIQTILVSLITGNLNFNLWYSYILFLIMVGGMLVLFMYMTSIASNEKFNLNMTVMWIFPLTLLIMVTLNSWFKDLTLLSMDSSTMLTFNQMNLSMNKFINFPLNIVLIFTMVYLLITLVATVKISSPSQGPLRQMFN